MSRGKSTNVAQLAAECLALGAELGSPLLAEALWEGDPQGDFLEIYVTGARGRKLAAVLGGQGSVDRYETPTRVAQRVLERLAKRGYTTWFPSPFEPDPECPPYAQRRAATACADCGKPTLPPHDAAVRPASLCSRCYQSKCASKRKARGRALLLAPDPGPTRRVVSFTITGARDGASQRSSGFISARDGSFEHWPMARALRAALPEHADFERDHELGAEAVATLLAHARSEVQRLHARLLEVATDSASAGAQTWDDRPLDEMSRLVRSLDLEGARLVLYSNAGFRAREKALVDDIRSGGGTMDRGALVESWREAFGDTHAVAETIERLLRLGFVVEQSDALSLTDKGRHGVSREDA